jgi:glycosyltransferase involved in cell wall biosynthesis
MKVSINSPIIDGAYGGGMSFVVQLSDYMRQNGIDLVNNLNDDDIDIIFHVNVTYTYAYSFYKALIYKLKHPSVIIVHRVNDSGLQRENSLMTKIMTLCSNNSDHLVFISSWLKDEMFAKLKHPLPFSIILNGVDHEIQKIYSNHNKIPWDGKSQLKIVTHHWSNNHDKGHSFYQALDKLLDNDDFKNKYEFTYIGNYPTNLKYKNTKLIPSMDKKELMDELSRHHIYLTGSKNEAAGYHAIEGISLGLPILYYDSGGIPEYANGYGLKFTKSDFELQLTRIYKEYFEFHTVVKKCNFSGEVMSRRYLTLFEDLLDNKELSLTQYSNGNLVVLKILYLNYRDKSLIVYKQLYSLYSRLLKLLKGVIPY